MGTILGKTCTKRKKKHQEDSGENIFRLWWTEHPSGGGRKSHQFKTSNVHLRWRGVYFTPSDTIPSDQWSQDQRDAKWRVLWNHEHPQYSYEKTMTSQAAAATVLKAVETRVLVKFTRALHSKVCLWWPYCYNCRWHCHSQEWFSSSGNYVKWNSLFWARMERSEPLLLGCQAVMEGISF